MTYSVLQTGPGTAHVIAPTGGHVITWHTVAAARHCAALLGHTDAADVPVFDATPISRAARAEHTLSLQACRPEYDRPRVGR